MSRDSPSENEVCRTDCLKREGIREKGMERKCTTLGVDVGTRPVRGPRAGWVNMWGMKAGSILVTEW